MDTLIKDIFEKLCEPIYLAEKDDVARITVDANSKGMLYSGAYFGQLYKTHEVALKQIALALVHAYKQANIFPDDTMVATVKKEMEAVVDEGLERLKARMRQSYVRIASGNRLDSELVGKLEPTRRAILNVAMREINIWAGLANSNSVRMQKTMTNHAFVIMRIGEKDTDQFYEQVVVPAAKACNLHAFPVNLTEGEKPITTRILDHIKTSRLVICDLTYERPNCYFEAGYALGNGVDCIFTARCDHDPRLEHRQPDQPKVHFDLDSMKITYWKEERFEECKAELEKRIKLLLGQQQKSPRLPLGPESSRKRFEAEGADL